MSVRKGDKLTIGDILSGNLQRDLAKFQEFSERFDEDYVENHKEKIENVRSLPSVKVKTGRNKKFTGELYRKANMLQQPMRFLEGYVRHAGDLLDVPVKSFGIREVRLSVRRKDLEALSGDLAVVNENIEHNKTVLMEEGLKQTAIAALIDLKAAIDGENTQQELNKEARKGLVESNNRVFGELDAINSDILDVGKRIFRGVSKAKYEDYVLRRILGRIRRGE